jgi:putative endopeptidase
MKLQFSSVVRSGRSESHSREDTRRPAMLSPLLMAIALCASTSMACAQSTGDAVPLTRDSVDNRIKPGDDFNAYANGGWLQLTELPADKGRWTGRDEIEETTKKQIAAVMQEAAGRPAGSSERKVADFRAAYLDEGAIESKGLGPAKPLLDRIGKVRDRAALTRLLGSDLRADVDPLLWNVYSTKNLFGLAVQSGIHGEKNNFAYLLEGGLGLPDRTYYLDSSPEKVALRAKYQDYIAHVLQLSGFDHARERAEKVMALETAIAQSRAPSTESENDHNADLHWSRADFAAKAPGMDWSTFFGAAGLSKLTDIVVWQPSAIIGEAALVGSTPVDTWKDYLRFHVIDRHADVLPRAFAEPVEFSATPPPSSHEQLAMEATTKAMPDAIGRMYVEKYFSEQTRARVQAIVVNVMDAFGKRIEKVTWMTPATKQLALDKIKSVYFGIGHPETWTDYSALRINARDAFGNQERVAAWNYRQALDRLGQPADKKQWVVAPQMVLAVYLPLQNGYNFSAAFLQAPRFDPSASDAANYGAIGATIGHETSHFFDTLGADYDAAGGMVHWWLPEDEAKYKALSEALVAQYSGYHPFPDLSVDGRLALSENIADLGGLSAAFDAYRRTLGDKVNDRDYVRQQDRQFFIGFARGWRAKMRDDVIRAKVKTDHAPEGLRIATVRNLDAWYDAFDVQPGQSLYLDPKARVRIW